MTVNRYPESTELSSWLRSEGARRAHQALTIAGLNGIGARVVVPLSGSTPKPGSREDRTCDRCTFFASGDDEFYPFNLEYPTAGGGVVAVFGGLCRDCWAKEVGA